jgi:hypothetical protein
LYPNSKYFLAHLLGSPVVIDYTVLNIVAGDDFPPFTIIIPDEPSTIVVLDEGLGFTAGQNLPPLFALVFYLH